MPTDIHPLKNSLNYHTIDFAAVVRCGGRIPVSGPVAPTRNGFRLSSLSYASGLSRAIMLNKRNLMIGNPEKRCFPD